MIKLRKNKCEKDRFHQNRRLRAAVFLSKRTNFTFLEQNATIFIAENLNKEHVISASLYIIMHILMFYAIFINTIYFLYQCNLIFLLIKSNVLKGEYAKASV